jgi:hypothetical protein
MAFPAVTNVDGSNPGPQSATLPDTVQTPVGNVWKIGSFTVTLSPASVANATSAEQTFTMTGLLTTDFVYVNKPTAQAGLGIAGARVSAANTLAITFGNFTGATITPTASEVYVVNVVRVQPNWTAPSSGSLIDW